MHSPGATSRRVLHHLANMIDDIDNSWAMSPFCQITLVLVNFIIHYMCNKYITYNINNTMHKIFFYRETLLVKDE